jgi:hypothetical protein
MIMRRGSWAILVLSLFGTGLVPAKAFADDEKREEKEERKEAKREGEREEEEPGLIFGANIVTGFGKVDAVNIAPSTSLITTGYVRESTRVTVVTPIFSLSYPVTRHIRLGVRLPLIFGSINPANDKARGAGGVGNVELEVEYERELTKRIGFEFGLGFALPTARGDELPEQDTLTKAGTNVNSAAFDKFSIAQAAQWANGGEENALFEPYHFGIIPKVALPMKFGRLKLEPYVKVENLIATNAGASPPVIVELVAGGRVAIALTSWFDLGVRAWGNFTMTAHEGRDLNIGVVEPEVRFAYKALHVTLGGLIPFAGEPSTPLFGGVRVNLVFVF